MNHTDINITTIGKSKLIRIYHKQGVTICGLSYMTDKVGLLGKYIERELNREYGDSLTTKIGM